MHPFKVVKGGQAKEPAPRKKKYAQFDQTRALGDRMMKRFFADRDKAIDKMRAKKP